MPQRTVVSLPQKHHIVIGTALPPFRHILTVGWNHQLISRSGVIEISTNGAGKADRLQIPDYQKPDDPRLGLIVETRARNDGSWVD